MALKVMFYQHHQMNKLLNSKPFTFERGPETSIQAKTAYEYTLDAKQAGRDDVRDMCIYLCTLLGYGNYWLILDELDKVDENEKDKYAPLLHIVRERTLKNWTMKEISDKEGLNIPLSISNEYYEGVASSIAEQISKGLPLLDCRVVGIANASDEIEEALFRRFAQVIMDSPMSLYPPTKEAGIIKKCVKDAFGEEQNLNDAELQAKLEFLKDVNLQWQYGFFPKLLNQTDRLGNFFSVDFMNYYNSLASNYPNPVDLEQNVIKGALTKTAIGKLYRDNFLNPNNEEELTNLKRFFLCFITQLFPDNNLIGKDDDSVGGGEMSPLQETREYIESQVQELGVEKAFRQFARDMREDFIETEGTITKISSWVKSTLDFIKASNLNNKGKYDQIPEVGGRMIPFVYQTIVSNLANDKSLDRDNFDQQMRIVYEFFTDFLKAGPKEGQVHELSVPGEDVQRALQGASNAEYQGMTDKQTVLTDARALGGTIEAEKWLKTLSGKIYKTKYFPESLELFIKYTLGDSDKYFDFKQNMKGNVLSTSMYINFLNIPEIKAMVQARYDRAPDPTTREMRNLQRLLNLQKR